MLLLLGFHLWTLEVEDSDAADRDKFRTRTSESTATQGEHKRDILLSTQPQDIVQGVI